MTPTEQKLKDLDGQIEFLAKEDKDLRDHAARTHSKWAETKAEKIRKVMETVQEYRRHISMAGIKGA